MSAWFLDSELSTYSGWNLPVCTVIRNWQCDWSNRVVSVQSVQIIIDIMITPLLSVFNTHETFKVCAIKTQLKLCELFILQAQQWPSACTIIIDESNLCSTILHKKLQYMLKNSLAMKH